MKPVLLDTGFIVALLDRRYFDAGPGFRNLPLGQKQTISNAAERGLTEAKKKTLSHGAGNIAFSPVWSKISNVLKRLGFRSRNFFAQLLSETSRACTIRVRRSSLGRLWNDLGSHACLHHRNRRPGTTTEERISGRREPHPESPNQRQVVVIRCRKSYVG